MPDPEFDAENIYFRLTQEDCPDNWKDGRKHLKSACRRCVIEAYDKAQQEAFRQGQAHEREVAAKIVEFGCTAPLGSSAPCKACKNCSIAAYIRGEPRQAEREGE